MIIAECNPLNPNENVLQRCGIISYSFAFNVGFFSVTKTVKFCFFRSSRTKNMMWYGVLGTKELVQKTYKNLEQRVQLEV